MLCEVCKVEFGTGWCSACCAEADAISEDRADRFERELTAKIGKRPAHAKRMAETKQAK